MTNDIIDAEFTPMFEGPMTCRSSDALDNWFLIERRDHNHTMWMERTEYGDSLRCSSRVSNADIEGSGEEMLAIAEAIEKRDHASFRRCEAIHVDGGFELCSPRNSSFSVFVAYDIADALAIDIRAAVANPALHKGEDARMLGAGEVGGRPELTRRLKP